MPSLRSQKLDFQTCNPSKGAPSDIFTAATTSVKPKLLLIPSVGTYANGMGVCGSEHGKADGDMKPWACEVLSKHPQSTTPFDLTTAYAVGDQGIMKECVEDEIYELMSGSASYEKGDRVKCAANGLVEAITLAGATVKDCYQFEVIEATTSKTSVLGKFINLQREITA